MRVLLSLIKKIAMTKTCRLVLFLLFFCPAVSAVAQEPFSHCSAAFVNGNMLVDEYTDKGKCVVRADASGELTVCTVDLTPAGSVCVDQIAFKIVIRDKNTGTLLLFSQKTFKSVDLRAVLAKCRPGDRIVLITLDDRFALIHNEILVQ